MTVMEDKRHRVEPVLTHQQMKKFKAEVRETILTLVNTHGVDYRMQKDGQHIFLYSGKRGERPFKIAASRPVDAQMRFLTPWIEEHVPGYNAPDKDEGATVEAIFKCAQGCRDASFRSVEEINAHYAEKHPVVEESHSYADEQVGAQQERPVKWEEPPAKPEPVESWVSTDGVTWEPWKDSKYLQVAVGRNPQVIRCVFEGCDFQRVGHARGVHLHENTHTGKSSEIARKGAVAKKAKAKKSKPDPAHPKVTVTKTPVTQGDGDKLYDALQTLAGIYGYTVVTAAMAEDLGRAEDDAMMITALRDEVARVEDERDALRKELDETRAKLALIREAMSL